VQQQWRQRVAWAAAHLERLCPRARAGAWSLQGSKSFFSEIIASISDIRFSRDGRFLLSRDYMNIKLWDMAMESKPLVTLPVHEELRPRVRAALCVRLRVRVWVAAARAAWHVCWALISCLGTRV
jgi:hypothetical protein